MREFICPQCDREEKIDDEFPTIPVCVHEANRIMPRVEIAMQEVPESAARSIRRAMGARG